METKDVGYFVLVVLFDDWFAGLTCRCWSAVWSEFHNALHHNEVATDENDVQISLES